MIRPIQFAAEAAKEITVAAVTNSSNSAAWASKDTVAEFYRTVYQTILETVQGANDESD